jgi:hypothetical protein
MKRLTGYELLSRLSVMDPSNYPNHSAYARARVKACGYWGLNHLGKPSYDYAAFELALHEAEQARSERDRQRGIVRHRHVVRYSPRVRRQLREVGLCG